MARLIDADELMEHSGWNIEDFYCAHGKRKDDNETTDI